MSSMFDQATELIRQLPTEEVETPDEEIPAEGGTATPAPGGSEEDGKEGEGGAVWQLLSTSRSCIQLGLMTRTPRRLRYPIKATTMFQPLTIMPGHQRNILLAGTRSKRRCAYGNDASP